VTEWPRLLSVIVPPHTESFGLGGRLPRDAYLDRLVRYAGAAEAMGATGAFVYDFPVAMDTWLVAYDVLAASSALEPVVAVRPHWESAEAVARRVVDLGYRFGRATHVNLVAGATRASRAPGEADATADRVAARRRLGDFAGQLRSGIDRRRRPGDPDSLLLTPASSTPGVVPADGVLLMARPQAELAAAVARARAGQGVARVAVLVGFVVRDTDEAAWSAAAALHPPDRRQEIAGRMFTSQVLSSEHVRSYALAEQADVHDECLWFGAPARGIDAPKVVGSLATAARWLAGCRTAGVTDLVVDLPADPGEYLWVTRVLSAVAGGPTPSTPSTLITESDDM
jgi:hypothetical protein